MGFEFPMLLFDIMPFQNWFRARELYNFIFIVLIRESMASKTSEICFQDWTKYGAGKELAVDERKKKSIQFNSWYVKEEIK